MVKYADNSGHAGENNISCCLEDVMNYVSQTSLFAPNFTALSHIELQTIL